MIGIYYQAVLGCSEVLGSPWVLNCVFDIYFFFFVNPAPNQSAEALLNVNKVFMLLTQSEGYTETTLCRL